MTNTPDPGTGLDAAANAFEAYLTGNIADTGDAQESNPEADAESDEETVEAQPEEDSSDTTPEDDAEPDDGDAEESAEEDESTEDNSAVDAPDVLTSKITVKNGDTIEEITVEEARKGWMRHSAFTRVTQELAQERKAFQAEVNAITQERQKLASLIPAIERQLEEAAPQEPDWDTLWQHDPIEAARQKHMHDQYREVRAAAAAEKQRVDAELARHQQQQSQALQVQEWERATQQRPEWKNPDRWAKDSAAILSYATELGFNAQDLAAADQDARILIALHEAAQYRALMQAKPKPQPQAAQRHDASPRPAPPSSKASAKPVSEITRAKQRLAKTGKADDLANLFDKFLK